jgi:RNA polymerase sigma-70 factor (ECF subfamily)
MTIEPDDLVSRARKGDRAAFDALVSQTRHRSLLLAKSRLADWADAEDAVQQAYLNAYTNLHRLHDCKRFDAWLCAIVINAASTVRRRRPVTVTLGEGADHEPYLANSLHPAEDDGEKDSVKKALRDLPDELATPFLLSVDGELTYEQIAEELKVDILHVKIRILRARQELKAALGQCEQPEHHCLSKTERKVLFLSEGSILTDDEIGQEVGIAPRSVKQRRSDAKKKLAGSNGQAGGQNG